MNRIATFTTSAVLCGLFTVAFLAVPAIEASAETEAGKITKISERRNGELKVVINGNELQFRLGRSPFEIFIDAKKAAQADIKTGMTCTANYFYDSKGRKVISVIRSLKCTTR